jgi:hypothetical protein
VLVGPDLIIRDSIFRVLRRRRCCRMWKRLGCGCSKFGGPIRTPVAAFDWDIEFRRRWGTA